MAFGSTPQYSQAMGLENFTHQQFLVMALEVASFLKWQVGQTSEHGFIAQTSLSMRSQGEEIRVVIGADTATITSECVGNQIIDYGKNKDNVTDFLERLHLIKNELPEETIKEKYKAISESFVADDEPALDNAKSSEAPKKISGVFGIFTPVDGYYVTPIIIDLNILVFLLMVISGISIIAPKTNELLSWGADYGPTTLGGEWWRLIVSTFIHAGIVHLLFNMYALLYIGILLERRLGRNKLLVAYWVTGVAASLSSTAWNPYIVSVGASGAIFGLYGVFLAMLTTNLIEKTARKNLLVSIGLFVVYNLINGLKPGIDNAAHIGGLISGLVLGYAYYPSLSQPGDRSLNNKTLVLVSAIALIGSGIVYCNLPNDVHLYETKMESFAAMEALAVDALKLSKGESAEKALATIKDQGMYYWEESIKLITEADRLHIPKRLHRRNKLLLQYCELKLKSYRIIYKVVDEDALEKYRSEAEDCASQIKEVSDLIQETEM